MKRVMMLVLTLALASSPAWAQSAGEMTIKDFRLRNELSRASMVLGAIALTDKLGIVCPRAIPVGEWHAALVHRQLDETRPWVEVLLELMDERGCKGEQTKGDT